LAAGQFQIVKDSNLLEGRHDLSQKRGNNEAWGGDGNGTVKAVDLTQPLCQTSIQAFCVAAKIAGTSTSLIAAPRGNNQAPTKPDFVSRDSSTYRFGWAGCEEP
jgi:hypothetical protein